MADADAAPHASPLPVRLSRPAALLVTTCLGFVGWLVAQRPVLPYGLKPGRHDVGSRRLASPGGELTAWYPARCGHREPTPAAPCPDAPADTGRFHLLLHFAWEGGLIHDDVVTAEYLASHGYVVATPASGAGASAAGFPLASAIGSLRALVDVDTSRIAVAGRGAGVTAARDLAARSANVMAIVEVDPHDGGATPAKPAGRRPPTLMVLHSSTVATPSSFPRRLTLRPPPGADPGRLIPAVTHLFLSATLRGWGDSLPALAARLRGLGL